MRKDGLESFGGMKIYRAGPIRPWFKKAFRPGPGFFRKNRAAGVIRPGGGENFPGAHGPPGGRGDF